MKKTNYGFWKVVNYTLDEAVEKTYEALKSEGFGVLADLDFKATLKKKLDVDFKTYRVLAACNPPNAFKALNAEEQIGLLLPCNVIVYVNDAGETIVSAIDPVANMSIVGNEKLDPIAEEIRDKLQRVIEKL